MAHTEALTFTDQVRAIPEGEHVENGSGTLTHHYMTDERGILQRVNLIVGTTNNNAAISMSIKKAAKGLVQPGQPVSDGILNTIEMAFRAYDPCLGCATHATRGETPLWVKVYSYEHELVQEIRRD
jgi:F420-non-reducing hydrogenase large subunit